MTNVDNMSFRIAISSSVQAYWDVWTAQPGVRLILSYTLHDTRSLHAMQKCSAHATALVLGSKMDLAALPLRGKHQGLPGRQDHRLAGGGETREALQEVEKV